MPVSLWETKNGLKQLPVELLVEFDSAGTCTIQCLNWWKIALNN